MRGYIIKREKEHNCRNHVSLSGRAHSVVLYHMLSRIVDLVWFIVLVFACECQCVCVCECVGFVCTCGLVINMHVYRRTVVCVRVLCLFNRILDGVWVGVWVCLHSTLTMAESGTLAESAHGINNIFWGAMSHLSAEKPFLFNLIVCVFMLSFGHFFASRNCWTAARLSGSQDKGD